MTMAADAGCFFAGHLIPGQKKAHTKLKTLRKIQYCRNEGLIADMDYADPTVRGNKALYFVGYE